MAKPPTSVIGLDLGRFSLKSVLLQRRGNDRYAITNCATHVLPEPAENAEALGREIKTLLKEMGGTAKACSVAVSSPEALIRIIEQPETPPTLLREAIRFNGMQLLNQDCKEFVLDCDRLPRNETHGEQRASQHRYLVGGLPRSQVLVMGDAVEKSGLPMNVMQLAPICNFNAFEFSNGEVFNNNGFFLVDIGHTSSTMMVGVKRDLALVRTIDFGGKALLEALTALSGEGRDSVFHALDQEDEVMVEYTRVALNALVREIQSSIGFLEHQREQTIDRVFVSGGPAKSRTLLKVMAEELHLPCEPWSAADKCENGLTGVQREHFAAAGSDYNVACGAAAELLKKN